TNWIVIIETPSRDTLLSSSTPWMVLMMSSSGLVTPVSISSGEAPRKVVVTLTMGSSTLGNWSTPISRKQNQPSTTNSRLIIVEKTGRLMQRSANANPLADGSLEEEGGECIGGSVMDRFSIEPPVWLERFPSLARLRRRTVWFGLR